MSEFLRQKNCKQQLIKLQTLWCLFLLENHKIFYHFREKKGWTLSHQEALVQQNPRLAITFPTKSLKIFIFKPKEMRLFITLITFSRDICINITLLGSVYLCQLNISKPSQVELRLSARGLHDADILSKSDPMIVVFEQVTWKYLIMCWPFKNCFAEL